MRIQYFLYSIVLLLFLSCGNITQQYNFKEDGTLEFVMESDPTDPNALKGVDGLLNKGLLLENDVIDTILRFNQIDKSKREISPEVERILKTGGLRIKKTSNGNLGDNFYKFYFQLANEDEKKAFLNYLKSSKVSENEENNASLYNAADQLLNYEHNSKLGYLKIESLTSPPELTGGMDFKMMASFVPKEELDLMKAEMPGFIKRQFSVPGKILNVQGGSFRMINDSTVEIGKDIFDIMLNDLEGIEIDYEPRSGITDPKVTEVWSPEPQIVSPGKENHQAPSDAIVLFSGKNAEEWKHADGSPIKWKIDKNSMTVEPGTGDIYTKESFSNCQLHIEWKSPKGELTEGQGKGNSGVFFHGGKYEIQILNSFENKTYVNGQAAAIYKQNPPMVNAMRPPGEWNTYDIIFHSPEFDEEGVLIENARMTAFHNGILVQDNFELQGTTEYIGRPKNIAHGAGPIMLQDHSNKVSFRNIWLRKL